MKVVKVSKLHWNCTVAKHTHTHTLQRKERERDWVFHGRPRPGWAFLLVDINQTEVFYWSTSWLTVDAVEAFDVHFTDLFITPNSTLIRFDFCKQKSFIDKWKEWVKVENMSNSTWLNQYSPYLTINHHFDRYSIQLKAITYPWFEHCSSTSSRGMSNIFRRLITCQVTCPSLVSTKNYLFFNNACSILFYFIVT